MSDEYEGLDDEDTFDDNATWVWDGELYAATDRMKVQLLRLREQLDSWQDRVTILDMAARYPVVRPEPDEIAQYNVLADELTKMAEHLTALPLLSTRAPGSSELLPPI